MERGGRIPVAVIGVSGPVELPKVKKSSVPKGTGLSPGRGYDSPGTSQGHLALPGSLGRGRTHLRLRQADDAPERRGAGTRDTGAGRRQTAAVREGASGQTAANDARRASVCKAGMKR